MHDGHANMEIPELNRRVELGDWVAGGWIRSMFECSFGLITVIAECGEILRIVLARFILEKVPGGGRAVFISEFDDICRHHFSRCCVIRSGWVEIGVIRTLKSGV